MAIPIDPIDKGYFDIAKYELYLIEFLGSSLLLKFVDYENQDIGFEIKLDNIIAYTDKTKNRNLLLIRFDGDGSSFGLDIGSRLKNKDLIKYKAVYLFEDEKHASFIFRALAENITINHIVAG